MLKMTGEDKKIQHQEMLYFITGLGILDYPVRRYDGKI